MWYTDHSLNKGTIMKKSLLALLAVSSIALTACNFDTEATVATQNVKDKAESFNVMRRISFMNAFSNSAAAVYTGNCSVEYLTDKFEVLCKDDNGEFLLHSMGRADNVFPIVEQLAAVEASTTRYSVVYNPTAVIPEFRLAK